MYSEDSFFTLGEVGRIGLVVLSISMAAILVWVIRRLPLTLVWRLLVAVVAFYLFVWLSPQVYYTFYRMIIPDLPLQWVVGMPPGLGHFLSLITFTGQATLSEHGQGALGWGLVLSAVFRKHADAAPQRIDTE